MQRALADELKKSLGLDETLELAKYIISLETDIDQIEYLEQLLGDSQKARDIVHLTGLQLRNVKVKRKKKVSPKKKRTSDIINCLNCGKIEYSGTKDCRFCNTQLLYWGETDEEELSIAMERKDRLLHYDQTSEQRTKVYDQQEDIIDSDYNDDTDDDDKNMKVTFNFSERKVDYLEGKAKMIYKSLHQSIS